MPREIPVPPHTCDTRARCWCEQAPFPDPTYEPPAWETEDDDD
jgi:hypothetical protein